jgi:hypothetical protein
MTGEQQYGRRANARRGAAKGSTRFSSDSEFINLELDTKQTAAYRSWRADPEEVINRWTELVEGGYRVNTKYDDYSSSCAAFIIPGEESENSGFILTGRGGNPYRAVSEAIYKHFYLLRGDWRSVDPHGPLERDSDF